MSRDKRKSQRYVAPCLVAYFWDGGTPQAHYIRDISFHGFYLLTEQRWYPGTMVTMTLQRTEKAESASKQSISVQVKAVRSGDDGVGFAFVLPQARDARRVQQIVSEGVELADKKALDRFLRILLGRRALIDEHC